MSRDPVLIWGAGAIGGILGAYWARAGVPVMMADIDADHAVACSTEGVLIEGPVEGFRQIVNCVTPDAVEGRYRCVVLAVKAQATEDAMRMLLPHLAEDGFVLSAQNGLNERLIAEMAGRERVMGAFVNYGSDWQAPGRILFGNRGAVVVGEIDGAVRPRTREMHRLLQIFEPDAVLTEEIWSYLWGKLGYGAMLFATALTPDSMSANFADPARVPALIALGREVMAVARAEGVKPRGFNGFDPSAFAPGAPDQAAWQSIAALADFTSKTAKTHSGIWRDLAVRRRRTEVDPQIGVITEIAASHAIEVPLLSRLVALIHDIEEGRRPQSAETFAELTSVLSAEQAS
ncbi:ketopantoate reductase family protein [Denitrobaculum tricleocarpae]|uniref:2-dehydropantoate 2-reductase n=1 Tax=Denitrobaculum tricleocarpae TaxID=2591009 RepID=A0A545TAY7_9PROT|nr:2-dehydropantoate 2-reductase N-terminal domain-containing protein [Denitrobaculum tricleocarpae]TQV74379.1 ketopantoate reductase family protein [Denitrobaculum tricleocarpae]